MYRIQAREMLAVEPEQLWEIITGSFELEFDDGVIQTTAVATFLSSFAWVFHRMYPKTPLLKEHHIDTVLKGKRMFSGADRTLLGRCLESTYEAYKGSPEVNRDHLGEILYRTVTKIYSDFSYRFEDCVTSVDMEDFVEILDEPRIIQSKQEQVPEAWSIKQAYRLLDTILKDRETLPGNRVSHLYQSGLVNSGQVHQSIGPRGYITDTDSDQFPFPVMRGYIEGLRSAYDSLIESRSASKALQFSKDNLRAAEYFSRKLQFADMAVKHLHPGDCGSQEYLTWPMAGARLDDDGEVVTPDDVTLLEGKKYWDDASGSLKTIQAGDKHLIGKTLKLRSVIHCNHPDPDGICETCFGELSMQVPLASQTNVGHLCCVNMTEPSTQSVLSVKHKDASAEIAPIVVDDADAEYLRAGRDRQTYLLAPRLAKMEAKLVIAATTAPALNDIRHVSSVEEFNISRISEMENIWLWTKEQDGYMLRSLKVHMGKRLSSMTYALLNHIRNRGWEVNNDGNYVIDMEGWNYNEPILALPLRHFNMSDHSKEISGMLQATKDQMRARDKTVSPAAFLVEFFNVVNSKLQINLAILEVIMYGLMVRDPDHEDYRLPKRWTAQNLGVYSMTMSRRSLSATMAYQDHYDVFVSPESYVFGNRANHVFDGLLMPFEVYGTAPLGTIME